MHYSVEETPLGTAGSVKHAEALLDETFLVISGDALCDFDLTAIVAAHKAGGAVATLGLKSVENPLEFGVVIIDEDGRIERFLEKPSWGQVFSDTINTGVYVLEPEVLRNVPADEPYDFSKQLFPALLSRGKHLYGHVLEGYWQDVGNLEQYRQANFDALDGRIELDLPGIRLRDNVYLGDGVQLPELGQIQGPAFVGNYSKIEPGARIGAYSVLGQNAVVKDGAQIERSVIDSGSYIGQSARIEGAILGKGVDVRGACGGQRGRGDRRRVLDRLAVGAGAEREGVPVQDDRGRGRDPLQPDLGVSRHHDPVRPRRGERPRQRRHHARRGLPDRDGLRHDAGARRADRGQPRRQPGGAHDQAVADIGACRDRRQRLRPAGGDAGRGPAPAQDRRAGGRRARPDLAG